MYALHTDAGANRTAAAIGAKAFTHGNHIWMGAGERPDDPELMAHEATHVVQQHSGRTPVVQRHPQEYEHPEDLTSPKKHGGGSRQKKPRFSADEAPPTVTREERAARKGELVPHSKPPADRPAQARPQTAAAACRRKDRSRAAR